MRRLIRDACRVHAVTVFWIGIGAGSLTWLFMMLLEQLDLTPLSLEEFMGQLTLGRSSELAHRLGIFVYLLASGAIAFAYACILRSAHRSGLAVGAHLALFHWSIASAVAFLGSPGAFFMAYGWRFAMVALFAHLVFGASIGWLFDRASIKFDYPRPLTTSPGEDHEARLSVRHPSATAPEA